MAYDPRTSTGIPTEPVGSLPRALRAPAGLRRLRRGRDRQGRARGASRTRRSRTRSSSWRRPARRSSPTASSAGRASRPTRSPTRWPAPGSPTTWRRRRPVLRDLRRRPQPPAAAADRRAVHATRPTPPTRSKKSIQLRPQADEAGRHRPVDARAALPAATTRCRATRATSSRRTWSTSARRTSGRRSPPAPRACRSTSPRAGWPPATTRATRGRAPGMLPHFIELNNRVMARFTAGGAREHRRPHLPRRRPRLGAQRRRALQRTCCRAMFKINAGYFLIQLASERDKDPVLRARSAKHSRDDADGVAQMCYIGVINPQNPRVESPQEVCDALVRAAELHPQGAARLDRRLRLLAVQHRREAQPRLARLRPRRGVPEDPNRVEGTRLAAEKLGPVDPRRCTRRCARAHGRRCARMRALGGVQMRGRPCIRRTVCTAPGGVHGPRRCARPAGGVHGPQVCTGPRRCARVPRDGWRAHAGPAVHMAHRVHGPRRCARALTV